MTIIHGEKYFPFENAADTLARWGRDLTWGDHGFSWRTSSVESEISFWPTEAATLDGFAIVGFVVCQHRFVDPEIQEITPLQAAEWNKYSSLSALLPATETTPPTIASRVTIYDGDSDSVHRLYAPLIVTEAYLQPNLFLSIASAPNGHGPEYFGLQDGKSEPPYEAKDFAEAQERCEQEGSFAAAHSRGITVEFPFVPGATPAGYPSEGGEGNPVNTSLCQIVTNEWHPQLGRGLLTTLRLPLSFSNISELSDAVTILNRYEVESVDMPPFLGAWCAWGQHTAAFAAFIPNELCSPGLPRTLAAWMGHRARRIPRSVDEIQRLARS